MVKQGDLMWQPPAEWVADANITAFGKWLGETRGLEFDDYQAMWRWSVRNLDDFWAAIWEYFDVQVVGRHTRAVFWQIVRCPAPSGFRVRTTELRPRHIFRQRTAGTMCRRSCTRARTSRSPEPLVMG